MCHLHCIASLAIPRPIAYRMTIIDADLCSALWDKPSIVALYSNFGQYCVSICGTCLGFRLASSLTGSSDPMLHVCHVKLTRELVKERTPQGYGTLEEMCPTTPHAMRQGLILPSGNADPGAFDRSR